MFFIFNLYLRKLRKTSFIHRFAFVAPRALGTFFLSYFSFFSEIFWDFCCLCRICWLRSVTFARILSEICEHLLQHWWLFKNFVYNKVVTVISIRLRFLPNDTFSPWLSGTNTSTKWYLWNTLVQCLVTFCYMIYYFFLAPNSIVLTFLFSYYIFYITLFPIW